MLHFYIPVLIVIDIWPILGSYGIWYGFLFLYPSELTNRYDNFYVILYMIPYKDMPHLGELCNPMLSLFLIYNSHQWSIFSKKYVKFFYAWYHSKFDRCIYMFVVMFFLFQILWWHLRITFTCCRRDQ